MKHFVRSCVVLVLFSPGAFGQTIPNAGFETWSNGTPTNWLTNNLPPTVVPITQSSSAHGGSSAVQGTVVMVSTFAFGPSLLAGPDGLGFPLNARPAALHGWYKFTPVSNDRFLVSAGFKKNGVAMGAASFLTTASQATYREFVANAVYNTGEIPDTIVITLLIQNDISDHVGSTFTVDDLAYGAAADVNEIEGNVPGSFGLAQNFPNPFNPTTKIQFQIPGARFVTMKVYNMLGQEVATLVNEQLLQGKYRAEFDASNLPSGTYFCRLQAGDRIEVRRMALLK